MKSAVIVAAVAGLASSAVAWHPPLNKDDSRIARKIPLPMGGGVNDAYPFSDDFESYAVGGLAGNGTWTLWAAGAVDGQVSTTQAVGTKSFKQIPQTDITNLGDVSTGIWELKCKTYCPSANVATTANDGGFIIGLNTWNAAAPGGATQDYSMQIQWQKGATGGPVVRDFNATAATCVPSTTVPIVFDQWVEFRAVINLTTDTYTAFYNNVEFVHGKSWSKGVIGCNSTLTIPVRVQAFDIYNGTVANAANANDTFYFDDFSFTQQSVPSCYANCDNSTLAPCLNVNDFSCFLNQYGAGSSYANCDSSTLVPVLNVNDFSCFLNKYGAGCGSPCAPH